MIIVRLYAGLGNQMFQYAAGLALAESRRTVLKLDVSWFREYAHLEPHNRYGLSCFNITEQFATKEEIDRVCGRPRSRAELYMRQAARALRVDKLLGLPPINARHYCPDSSRFDDAFASLPDDMYIDGFYQSERYFANIGHLLRQHFSFRYPASPEATALSRQIRSAPSIAVHFRRGDYTHKTHVAQLLGPLGFDYQYRAMVRMRERFPDAMMYIFSDDIEEIAREVTPPGPHVFVRGALNENPIDVIRLMSLCDHAIISNSTFAWWGAWLNPRPDKQVIAPRPWCADPSLSDYEIVPERWHRLPRSEP